MSSSKIFATTGMELAGENTTNQTANGVSESNIAIIHGHYVFLPIRTLSLILIVICFIALTKTCKVPKSSKCLSGGLLIFDFLANVCFTIRVVSSQDPTRNIFDDLGASLIILSHVTIAFMSLDRLVAFQWPNIYIKTSFAKKRNCALAFWAGFFLLNLLDRFVYSRRDDSMFFFVLHTAYRVFLFTAIIITTCGCYMQVFRIIKKQSKQCHVKSKSLFQHYKSTTVIIIYMFNVLLTSLLFGCILFVVKDKYLAVLLSDIVNLGNGLFDAITYVLWFRECRMELLKIFSKCFPSLNQRVEVMRIEIFDIWTIPKRK